MLSSPAQIDIGSRKPCTDLITNARQTPKFKIEPFEVRLLHIQDARRPDVK